MHFKFKIYNFHYLNAPLSGGTEYSRLTFGTELLLVFNGIPYNTCEHMMEFENVIYEMNRMVRKSVRILIQV